LDEAILLADRILVLKPDPGEVEELIEVPVARPRTGAQSLEAPFLATRKHLDHLIHPAETEDDHFNMIRLAPVGDDVEPQW
ncbi:MAG: ABC transporter ATP-binding protein, partial [Saprospiraceae bacterium]